MFYSQELVEEVRVQNDIVDVISQYVSLKQKGSSFFGLCPFHNENTPSFSVSPEKQLYYCFGCGATGNVYSFVMQMENCDFLEALQKLADRVNITLPEPELSGEAKKEESLKKALYEIHTLSGRFYFNELNKGSSTYAQEYLEKRQIQRNILRKFGIGYSPEKKDELYKYLVKEGFSEEQILKSGLVLKDKNGNGFHDRFRNRVMFPIFDVRGRCIGFGGRIISSGEPKYLNSPETPIFNKSKNLYGLNFARASKMKELILVEGYMDMITIYQAGFKNVVASLGTAFNAEHAKTLKKFAEDIILLFDSDEAGINAALRAIPVLTSNGFRVKVLNVPGGKDPDEFIKKYGSREFSKLLLNAENYITFQVNCIRKQYNMQNTEHRVIFTTEAAKVLSKVDSEIERDAYIKEISGYTNISEEAIKNEILKIINKEETSFRLEADKKRIRQYSTESISKNISRSTGILKSQKSILYLCSKNANVCKKVSEILKPYEYSEPVYKKTAELIYDAFERGNTVFPAEIVNYFLSVEEQRMASEIFNLKVQYENLDEMEKGLTEEVKLIKKTNIDIELESAKTVEEIQSLINSKRKLDELNITISDG